MLPPMASELSRDVSKLILVTMPVSERQGDQTNTVATNAIANTLAAAQGKRECFTCGAGATGVPRESPLEKTLYACDELAGFITAISYVKPHRSVFEVDVSSVKKKMKDKAFARSLNRQDIVEGAQERGVPLDEHIEFCLKAMQARAEELGLKGNLDA